MRFSIRIAIIAILVVGGFFLFILTRKSDQAMLNDINELQVLTTRSKDYALCLDKANAAVKKYSSNKDAWQWKALCEFQLGNFPESKFSFEKLLALDPENKVAKNYLKTLNSGSKLINIEKEGISQEEVESLAGFKIDPKILRFKQALRIPAGKNPEQTFLSAEYVSSVDLTPSTFIQNYIKKQLKEASLKFSVVDAAGFVHYTVVNKSLSPGYIISITKTSPVRVTINFNP